MSASVSSPSSATSHSLAALSASLADAIASAAPSIVSVHSHRCLASGFVWKPGLILTSEETLAEEGEIEITTASGQRLPATTAGRDPSTDIALLRVANCDAPALKLASAAPRTGEIVLVAGTRGGAPVAAMGVVAHSGGAWRSLRGGEIEARLELDVRLRRASEGGPALNSASEVFGMAVSGPRRSCLVLPSATLERVATRLESHGRIARGYLGLGLQSVRVSEGSGGAMVMSVDADGPGAAAGAHQGDVIVSWNGAPFAGLREIMRKLGPASVGATVTLGLRRGGAPLEIKLTLAERPQ